MSHLSFPIGLTMTESSHHYSFHCFFFRSLEGFSRWRLVAYLMGALATFSKENGAMALFVAVAFAAFPNGRRRKNFSDRQQQEMEGKRKRQRSSTSSPIFLDVSLVSSQPSQSEYKSRSAINQSTLTQSRSIPSEEVEGKKRKKERKKGLLTIFLFLLFLDLFAGRRSPPPRFGQ